MNTYNDLIPTGVGVDLVTIHEMLGIMRWPISLMELGTGHIRVVALDHLVRGD